MSPGDLLVCISDTYVHPSTFCAKKLSSGETLLVIAVYDPPKSWTDHFGIVDNGVMVRIMNMQTSTVSVEWMTSIDSTTKRIIETE